MDRQISPRERKASKSVRFTDVEESAASPRGRIPSQSDVLAEALLPQLTKALSTELRSVFVEEAMRWSEELQLLCHRVCHDCSGLSSKRSSRKNTLGFSSGVDARWSEHLEKSQLQEQEKEQEKLQKRRLGRLVDTVRSRFNGGVTWQSENTAPSETLSSPGLSPRSPRSPHGAQRHKSAGGRTDVAFTNIKDAEEVQDDGACPDNVCLNFENLREGAKGSPSTGRPSLQEVDSLDAGRRWQKMKSFFQQSPARSLSCPELAPLVLKGALSNREQSTTMNSDDEETCPVTTWDAGSVGGLSDATSVGDVIRRNRQATRSATTPAVLKRPEVSLASAIASNPFMAYQTEKSVDLQPPGDDTSVGDEPDEPRGHAKGRDLVSITKAYNSTNSQVSKASDRSIMTIASVTTTRTVATHTEEQGRHHRRNLESGPEKHHASARGEQASECDRTDRACMLGVDGPDKKAPKAFARQQSTRQLAEIEQTLCAELFKAQELLPKRRSNSDSDEVTERLSGSSIKSVASRWPMVRRFQYAGSSDSAASSNTPPIRPHPARNGARLPPAVVGVPSGEPALLMTTEAAEHAGTSSAGDCDFSAVNPSPPSPKGRTLFRWPKFEWKSRDRGAESSVVRHTARKRTPEISRSQMGLTGLQFPERQSSSEFGGSTISSSRTVTTASPTTPKTPPARSLRKKMSCSEMRQQQEKALVESLTQEIQDAEVCEQSHGAESTDSRPFRAMVVGACKRLCVVLPRACGVDPWNSHHPWACAVYQWTVLLLALSCTVLFTLNAYEALSQEENLGAGQAEGLSFVLNVILSLGALLSLVACGSLWRSQAIHDIGKMLRAYALKCGCVDEWEKGSLRDLGFSLAVWLGAVTFIMMNDQRTVVSIAFALTGLLHVGIITCILHTCRCLANMIDAFCDVLVDRPDFSKAAFNWNLFQAVCRTACGSIQAVFTVQQAMATSAAVVCVADLRHGFGLERALVLAPTLLLILAILRTSVWAAAISDKCARVPMLVNSLSFGSENDLDRDRMYIVEYIVHSRAGFYIFDVRLTSASVLKAIYIAGAVTLGLASQML